jgi:hypothetical protein
LIQQFEARWERRGDCHAQDGSQKSCIASRIRRSKKSRAGLRDGVATTEYDIQQKMVGWFKDEGLIADSAPCVSAQENAGNPHYLADGDEHRVIRKNELVLLDLWGKLETSGPVYADITWIGFTGPNVPERMTKPFRRDLRRARCGGHHRAGRGARGPRRARLRSRQGGAAGSDRRRLRRRHPASHWPQPRRERPRKRRAPRLITKPMTNGRLLPGSGFTIEPGLYFKDFGVRTEINMVWLANGPEVTGPRQKAILCLLEE